jgi:hypothetical protein
VAEEPDLDVCEEIYFQTYDEHTPSALRGVERLPRGWVLLADGSGARLRRYWDPTDRFESGHYGPDEIKDRFDHLMGQAVARTLTGQDAVSLSGGIDSPAVAAYGASRHLEMAGRPLEACRPCSRTFQPSTSPSTRAWSPTIWGLPLHSYRQHARPLDRLDEWTRLTDGPVPTISLPQYEEHYRVVRGLGYRSVLTGEFAEFVVDMSTYLIPYLVWHGRWGAVARLQSHRRARGGSWASVLRSLANPFVPTRVTAYRWARSRTNVPTWLDRRRVNEPAVRSIVPVGSNGPRFSSAPSPASAPRWKPTTCVSSSAASCVDAVGGRRPVGVLPQPSGRGEVPRYQGQDARPEAASRASPRSHPGPARQDVFRRFRAGQHRLSNLAGAGSAIHRIG